MDWTGSKYVGIDLEWDYDERTVKLSMDGYVEKALKKIQHALPRRPVNGPSPYQTPAYGENVQYAKEDNTSPLPKEKKHYSKRYQKIPILRPSHRQHHATRRQ